MAKKTLTENQKTNSSTAEQDKKESIKPLTGEVVNTASLARVEQIDLQMRELMRQTEGIAITVGSLLWEVDEKKLYKELDYKSTADMAMDRYGLAKSTVSETLKVMKKFGLKKDGYTLLDKYREFGMSKLIKMCKLPLPSDHIRAEITPQMSRNAIAERIKEFNDLQESMDDTDFRAWAIEDTLWIQKLLSDESQTEDSVFHTLSYSTMKDLWDEYTAVLLKESEEQENKEPESKEPESKEQESKDPEGKKSENKDAKEPEIKPPTITVEKGMSYDDAMAIISSALEQLMAGHLDEFTVVSNK